MNRLLFDHQDQVIGLDTPIGVVAPSERSQIVSRLDNFVSEAKVSD